MLRVAIITPAEAHAAETESIDFKAILHVFLRICRLSLVSFLKFVTTSSASVEQIAAIKAENCIAIRTIRITIGNMRKTASLRDWRLLGSESFGSPTSPSFVLLTCTELNRLI